MEQSPDNRTWLKEKTDTLPSTEAQGSKGWAQEEGSGTSCPHVVGLHLLQKPCQQGCFGCAKCNDEADFIGGGERHASLESHLTFQQKPDNNYMLPSQESCDNIRHTVGTE